MALRDNLPSNLRRKVTQPQPPPSQRNRPIVHGKTLPSGQQLVGGEPITLSCGHVGLFPLLAGEKPEFARKRREKYLTKKRCQQCLQEAQVKHRKEARRKRHVKKLRAKPQYRLPNGSTYQMTFDEKATLWRGTLTVPLKNGEMFTAAGEASGIRPLIELLGDAYMNRNKMGKE